jgi:hypothetical protein
MADLDAFNKLELELRRGVLVQLLRKLSASWQSLNEAMARVLEED